MKTTKKLNEGFLADTANRVPAETAPAAAAQSAVEKKDSRLPIDTEARKKNRTLPTPKVLELLKNANPGLFNLAEVVGKWIWVSFRETPAPELRQQLAVFTGIVSGRLGSTLAAHFACAVSKTRTRSMPVTFPPTTAPPDSHHETEQTSPAVAAT